MFAVCGLPCSGKSRFAHALASEFEAVCFSADAWVLNLYGPKVAVEDFPRYRVRVWEQCWCVAARLLELGVTVVLDFSFYRQQEREQFRARAAAAGADFRMYYLDCPPELARARLQARNRALPPDTFRIDPATFEALLQRFEPPKHAEATHIVRVSAEVDLPLG